MLVNINCSLSNTFCEFVFNWNLTQHITDPTHAKGNVLDIVLMTCNILISDVSIFCHNPLIHSDHSIIIDIYGIISFNLKYEAQFSVRTLPHLVFDYSRADWNGLSDYLMDCTSRHRGDLLATQQEVAPSPRCAMLLEEMEQK